MRDDDPTFYRVPGRSFYATLVPFPIACFIGAFLTDLAYVATVSDLWETFSVWLLTIGLVVAAVAAVAGIVDLVRSRRVLGLGRPWLRVLGELVAVGLSVVNVFIHSRDCYTAVVPEGLILSALVVLVLAATLVLGRSATSYRTESLT